MGIIFVSALMLNYFVILIRHFEKLRMEIKKTNLFRVDFCSMLFFHFCFVHNSVKQ